MQNNIFSKINVSTRILILLLLSLSIFIANSIYLIIFMSILSIILLILTNKSVKLYIFFLENVKTWLLFIFIAYIIIFRNVLNSFIFIYKLMLIILIVKQFSLTVNFQSLTSGVKTLLKPLNKFNLDKLSYDIVIFIYFINFYINSKKEIFTNYTLNKKISYSLSLKHNILPRLFLTISKINKLESSLRLKFCKIKFEKNNIKSNIILFAFLVLFIIVVFKEVIL